MSTHKPASSSLREAGQAQWDLLYTHDGSVTNENENARYRYLNTKMAILSRKLEFGDLVDVANSKTCGSQDKSKTGGGGRCLGVLETVEVLDY